MLKRLDCRKDALNYHHINFSYIHNYVTMHAILVNVKIIVFDNEMCSEAFLSLNTTTR